MQKTSLFGGGDHRLATEQKAEEIILEFLRNLPGVSEVRDVRSDKEWQKKEVDFIVIMYNGMEYKVEAKSDKHIARSQNMLFELARIHHTSATTPAYLGWSVFTESDRIIVYCPPDKIYKFSTVAMKSAMQTYVATVRQDLNLAPVASDDSRTTINILVPLEYVEHEIYDLQNDEWIKR